MPSLLLTVDRDTFVAWLTADTTTPGITAPLGSLTKPLRLACPVCAERMQAETTRRDPSASALDHIVWLLWNQDEIEHSIHPDESNDTKKCRLGPIVALVGRANTPPARGRPGRPQHQLSESADNWCYR